MQPLTTTVRTIGLLCAFLPSLACLAQGDGTPSSPLAVTVSLCTSAGQQDVTDAWSRSVIAALVRLSHAGYRQTGASYDIVFDRTEACFEQAHDACYGVAGHVYCDADVLARQMFAVGLVAVGMAHTIFTNGNPGDNSKLMFRSPLSLVDGLEIYDALSIHDQKQLTAVLQRLSHNDVDTKQLILILDALRRLNHYDSTPAATIAPDDGTTTVAYQVYEAATNYVIAYVVGHELAHAFATCIHHEAAPVETSGLLHRLAGVQAAGHIVCENSPLIDELRADACGLRTVTRMDRDMVAWKRSRYSGADLVLAEDLLSISRRLAIDVFSVLSTATLAKRSDKAFAHPGKDSEGIPYLAYVSEIRPGYLYSPIRSVLLASLFNTLEDRNKSFVRICDDTAQRFVLGLNVALTHCRTQDVSGPLTEYQQKLAEEFGEFVPSGVIEGWRTGKWVVKDLKSFRCP